DLHVVNSCTVTAAAARSSRQAARAAVRRAPAGAPRTVLTGCYATAAPAEAAGLAGVDLVVPNRDKEHLLEWVNRAFPGLGPESLTPARSRPAFPEGFAGARRQRLPHANTRALVKI